MEVRQQPATLTTTRVIALTASIGIGLLAVLGMQATREATNTRAERDATAALGRATTSVFESTSAAVGAVDTIAARSTTTGGPASVAGLAVDARVDGVSSVSWLPQESADSGGPEHRAALASTLAIARDQGRLRLSPPFEQGNERVVAAVRAVYREGAVLTVDGGFGTSGQRRDRLAGWVVGIVPTAPLVDKAAQDSLTLVAKDGSAIVGRHQADTGGFAASNTFKVAGRMWTLSISADTHASPGLDFWLPPTIGALLIGILAVAVRWRAKHNRLLEEQLTGLQSQLAMIGDVAPVVQQTLDLGEVLPAAAVRLTDRLSLAGVSFTFVDDHGRHTEVFAYGATTSADAVAVVALPEGVPGHADLALSLQRGGRLGGIVRARTTRPLSATECAGLGAVAEMISSALVTARLFDQQAQAVKRLSEVDALKSTFLETASHELRTPVTAIAGFARLAHEQWDELPEDQRKLFIERIWANASVLDNLVADLLNFSRMERGGLQAHNEPVALSSLVPEIVTRLSPIFDTHRINSEISPGVVVLGERRGIEQIVTNLLSNAVKFSPVDSHVAVRLAVVANRAVLSVDDQGPGVPHAERERIFSRFFRGRGPVVIRTRGAGIGLSVVTALAEQMDATVEVGDSPTGGARFTVSFPIPSALNDGVEREESHVAQS